MIITEQKPFSEVEAALKGKNKVFITGCGSCATAWKTGGAPEVEAMKEALTKIGKTVTGTVVSEEGCDSRKIGREFRHHKAEIDAADALVIMACGAGCRAQALAREDKPIRPTNNTMFLARMERLTKSEQGCVMCGECILDKTGGLCPMTACPKELVNGPCGGYNKGMCEVDPDRECAWIAIYNRLKRFDELDNMREIQPPKNQAKRKHPQAVDKTPAKV